MRILLVEDESDAAAVLAKGLREHAYAVDIASDGRQALDVATTNDYDLIQRELVEGAEAIDFDEFGYRLGSRDYSDDKVRQYVEFVEGTKGILLPVGSTEQHGPFLTCSISGKKPQRPST